MCAKGKERTFTFPENCCVFELYWLQGGKRRSLPRQKGRRLMVAAQRDNSLQQQAVLPLLAFTSTPPPQGPHSTTLLAAWEPLSADQKLWGTPTCAGVHLAVKSGTSPLHVPQVLTEQPRAVQGYWTHRARFHLLIAHTFPPASPLVMPCQLGSSFLRAGWSRSISCWLYSSCLDTTQFLQFLITHFLAWSPLENPSSDNTWWPFFYYFPLGSSVPNRF